MPVYTEWGIEPLKDFELDNKGRWDGEAYADTIFIKSDCVNNEGLMFHELVHTVQYKLMGIEHFLIAYGFECATQNYPNGKLEQMAKQFESIFRTDSRSFDVEEEIKPIIEELERDLFAGVVF